MRQWSFTNSLSGRLPPLHRDGNRRQPSKGRLLTLGRHLGRIGKRPLRTTTVIINEPQLGSDRGMRALTFKRCFLVLGRSILIKGAIMKRASVALTVFTAMTISIQGANAASGNNCIGLPNHATLQAALNSAVTTETSGLDFNMWATIVNRDGVVCGVAFSGSDRGAQWPGSRAISAQKANTANAFSLGPVEIHREFMIAEHI